jgi:hypothetical protein
MMNSTWIEVEMCCKMSNQTRFEYCEGPSSSTLNLVADASTRGFLEAMAMVLITGITNASGIPSIVMWGRRGRYFEVFIGILTLL